MFFFFKWYENILKYFLLNIDQEILKKETNKLEAFRPSSSQVNVMLEDFINQF